jgi:hypothetical protein
VAVGGVIWGQLPNRSRSLAQDFVRSLNPIRKFFISSSHLPHSTGPSHSQAQQEQQHQQEARMATPMEMDAPVDNGCVVRLVDDDVMK